MAKSASKKNSGQRLTSVAKLCAVAGVSLAMLSVAVGAGPARKAYRLSQETKSQAKGLQSVQRQDLGQAIGG